MVWRRFCYAPSECGEGWWHEKGNEEADWRMLLKEHWWLIGYEYRHFMQIQIIVQVTTLTQIVLWEKFWNNPKPFSTVTNSQLSQYRFPLLTKWIHSHKKQFCSKETLTFLLICIMNLKTCGHGNKKSPNGYCVVPLTRRSWAGPGLLCIDTGVLVWTGVVFLWVLICFPDSSVIIPDSTMSPPSWWCLA